MSSVIPIKSQFSAALSFFAILSVEVIHRYRTKKPLRARSPGHDYILPSSSSDVTIPFIGEKLGSPDLEKRINRMAIGLAIATSLVFIRYRTFLSIQFRISRQKKVILPNSRASRRLPWCHHSNPSLFHSFRCDPNCAGVADYEPFFTLFTSLITQRLRCQWT